MTGHNFLAGRDVHDRLDRDGGPDPDRPPADGVGRSGSRCSTTFFGWGGAVPGGIQTVRMLHFLLTFMFVAFAIHHVYSAILVDYEERGGTMSSIFSGWKNLKPGRTLEALGVRRPRRPGGVQAHRGGGSREAPPEGGG